MDKEIRTTRALSHGKVQSYSVFTYRYSPQEAACITGTYLHSFLGTKLEGGVATYTTLFNPNEFDVSPGEALGNKLEEVVQNGGFPVIVYDHRTLLSSFIAKVRHTVYSLTNRRS